MRLAVSPHMGAAFGLAGVGAWLAFYLVAAIAAATSAYGYDLARNFLSDLGNPRAPAPWAFNLANILGGLMFLPFAVAVAGALGGRLSAVGGVFLGAAATFLVLVGVFPEESPNNLHFIVSILFFGFLTLAALALAIPLRVSPRFGPIPSLLAAATVAGAVAFILSGIRPIFEHVAVYLGLAWTAGVAIHLLRIPR